MSTGIFDNEMILPGAITEIESDYSYGYDTSLFGTTDSVTIIGTAFNGPVGTPVQIYSPEHAKYIFGETYDSNSRREATLVAEIQNTWDRGCRTIYAVRVSGKSISKDFSMVPETKLKLRVSGMFPSNDNKDVYMVYDDTVGASTLSIYKPAKRATIQQKLEGLVESDESILVSTLQLTNSYGLTKDSRLVELIKLVNDYSANNVIRLSIVDEYGNDVTISSKEAQALSIGAIFPGAYFIGREVNNCVAVTDMSYVFVDASNPKPYDTFEGQVYKKLTLNTDINSSLPIVGSMVNLNAKFKGLIQMTTMFDFLAIPGKVDIVFGKDSIDYEQVEMSDFDLYSALGSGYAVTAKAEYKDAADPAKGIKVKEAPVSDPNRIQSIKDGIYSMLENLNADYRVLANGVADATITGKIPKKDSFKVATANTTSLFNDLVIAKAKVDSADMTAAKQYSFSLGVVPTNFGNGVLIKPDLYTTNVVKRVAAVNDDTALKEAGELKSYKNGTLFFIGTAPTFVLNRYANGALTALSDGTVNSDLNNKLFLVGNNIYKATVTGAAITYAAVLATEFGTKKDILVESGDTVSIYEVIPGADPTKDPATVQPIGGLDEIFGDNEDKTLVTVQSEYESGNNISIKSAALDYSTLEEFVSILNENKDLAKLFEFSLSDAGVAKKDEYVLDLSIPATASASAADKTIAYDMNLYIPYKTTDNFARHLAQHCTYTSLKTAPTHGILGCGKLMDVNLNSVANKVDAIANIDLYLYAKRTNGKDMLDRNNLPYPIGRNISVVLGQYTIAMDTYNYISNGAAGYAGMVSQLPLDQSSTSQPISIPTPMYELTNYQLEKLTQKGFVTFKNSYTKGYVVTDGITMAPSTSSFRRLSVTRIVNAIEEVIRAATEPFIGKQNHLANRNSMQTAIKSALDKLKGKLIESYDFKLTIDPANLKLGIVDIDYSIVPIYEIREVRNRITVKESL
jgi:hypothetical protein